MGPRIVGANTIYASNADMDITWDADGLTLTHGGERLRAIKDKGAAK